MSEVCDQVIRFSYIAERVDAVLRKQRASTRRERRDRHRPMQLAIALHHVVRGNPFSESFENALDGT